MVLLGALAALATLPDDPQPEGALFWPAVCLTCGLLSVVILRLRRDIRSILRADNILMLGLVYWLLLDPLQSAYPFWGVNNQAAATAFSAIALFALAILLGASGRGWFPPRFVLRSVETSISARQIFRAILICFALGIFYFAWSSSFDLSVMIDNLGESRFSAVWSREALGGWNAFLDHLVYFGYALPALTVILAFRRGWLHPTTVVAVILTLVMVLFLAQSGGRRIVGVVVGSGLLCWLLMQGRFGIRQILVGGAVVAALLSALQVMLQARTVGFESYLSSEEKVETLTSLRVDDNLLRLSQIVMLFPDVQDFVGVQPLIYTAVKPVPRVIWPEKPVDPGYDLTMMVGLADVQLTSSIIGDLYASYGLLAVALGGFVLGRLSGALNHVLARSGGTTKPVVIGLGVMALFVSLRAMNELVLMSYSLLGWFVISQLFLAGKDRAASERPSRP